MTTAVHSKKWLLPVVQAPSNGYHSQVALTLVGRTQTTACFVKLLTSKLGSKTAASEAAKPLATASPTTLTPAARACWMTAAAPALITCTTYSGTLTSCASLTARYVASSCRGKG